MKNLILITISLFWGQIAFSQIGIGTTDPKATLDISSSSLATPNATDGILIPRINNFPVTNPTADQDGMMVFATGNGTPTKGFYYWDQATTSWIGISSGDKNTLDQAYDEGGVGAGRTITADNGAVLINGTDGFQNTGTFGSGATLALSGAGTKMFFYPRKSAFRAGYVNGNQWNDTNIGNYSSAFGLNNTVSGSESASFGNSNTVSGQNSTVFGYQNTESGGSNVVFGQQNNVSGIYNFAVGALNLTSGESSFALGENNNVPGDVSFAIGAANTVTYGGSFAIGSNLETFSGGETVMGFNSTAYTATSPNGFNANDRLFAIGNGISPSNRSNALTIYKSGLMNINDEYNMPLTDGTNGQVMTTDGSGQVSFTTISTTDTQNTLDQAYDEGGAGAGRTITADNGAVLINGNDGLQITGTFNAGAILALSGAGTKMFFYPRKGALRAGRTTSTQWDDVNIGAYSNALGLNNRASGDGSTAFGRFNQASGENSTAIGIGNEATGEASSAFGYATIANADFASAFGNQIVASSFSEMAFGTCNNQVIPNSTDSFDAADQLFSIGNGQDSFNRSNALTIYKSGLMNINDTYNMPLTAGTNGQVMTTDGSGNVTFQNPNTGTDDQNLLAPTLSGTTLNLNIENGTGTSINLSSLQDGTGTDDQNIQNLAFNTATSILTVGIENGTSQAVNLSTLNSGGDVTSVTAGTGLTGGGVTGAITLNAVGTNGLTTNADDIILGGTLIQATTITQGANDMTYNLNGIGNFNIQDAGSNKLTVLNNGDTVLGGDLYMRDENTAGNVLGRLIDINGDDGALDLYNSNVLSTRINGGGDSYLTGGNLGIGTITPDYNLSVTGTLNLREDIAGGGAALRVNGTEALWFDGNLFSWGFGGTANFFSDDVGIGINAPAHKLDVRDNQATNYVAQIYNISTNANADGLKIRVGNPNAPVSSTTFIGFFDGNGGLGTNRGRIEGNGVGVTYNTTSDGRLKTNISSIDSALQLIDRIQPRRYEYKTNLGTQEYGFIAQELQPLYPQAVSGTPDSDVETNPMMVDYSRLTPLLTAGIKELKKEVDVLKEENQKLKAELAKYESLEARLSALENNTKKESEVILASKN